MVEVEFVFLNHPAQVDGAGRDAAATVRRNRIVFCDWGDDAC